MSESHDRRALRVQCIRDLNQQVRELVLRPLDPSRPLRFSPGAHIEIELRLEHHAERRCYSLVRPEQDGAVIAVRRDDAGRGGSRAVWQLCVGDKVSLCAQRNDFEPHYETDEYLLVAAGIGITPMPGIASALLAAGKTVRLVHIARHPEDFIYAEAFDQLRGMHTTRIQSARLGRPDPAALIALAGPQATCHVCGPRSLIDALELAWRAAGRRPERLRSERFAGSGALPAAAFDVYLRDLDRRVTIPSGRSMLDALEDAGIELASFCRRGECGVCTIDIDATCADVEHRDGFMTAKQQQRNQQICPCVSRARGVLVIDSGFRPDSAGR